MPTPDSDTSGTGLSVLCFCEASSARCRLMSRTEVLLHWCHMLYPELAQVVIHVQVTIPQPGTRRHRAEEGMRGPTGPAIPRRELIDERHQPGDVVCKHAG